MAAPSGTVWGSVYGSYAKLGFYITHSSSATSVTTTVQVWYWSKYGTYDKANTFYYDNLASSGSATTSKGTVSIDTSVNTGSGWSTSNQSLLATYTHTHSKTTSTQTRYVYAKLNTIETIDGGTVSAGTTYTVDKLASYTVSYNANGGSGAPSAQTKWYGTTLKLQTTKPTRTGYTFQGWATSSTGSVAYAAGANYTANAAVTLYAVWKANTYTVSYNANGGSGAPSAQTKTYGVTLTLSSTKPTRTNYTFKGWATSASGSVAYAAGGSYTANTGVTLYAVWELAYIKPTISITTVARCTSDGTLSDIGTYIKVAFSWTTYYNSTTVKIEWKEDKSSVTTWSSSAQTTGSKSGTVNAIVGSGAISEEKNYAVQLTVGDSNGSTVVTRNINSMSLPIDVLAGGTGVAIGKVAETADMLDVKYQARFRNHVYMDKDYYIHELPANGSTGYWKFATITPYGTYADGPMIFEIHQRGGLHGYVHFHYSGNATVTSHALNTAYVTGTIKDVYYESAGDGAYNLYLLKNGAWDAATIVRLEMGEYQRLRVGITWKQEYITAVTSTMSIITRGSYYNDPIYMPNSTAIYMKNAAGTYRNALHLNQSNSLNLGYGGYAASEGETIVYGNKVQILSGSGAHTVTFNKGLYTYGGFIEIVGSTPFIDFHYGSNSSADYTARIIESASGKLTVYNSISNASDANLKKDIEDLPEDYLNVLKNLKPTQYRFIKGDDYLNVGFIAQDVEEAFIDAGFVDIPIVNNDDGVYGLDYNGFIAMLVQGYQKQQEEIEYLKNDNSSLHDTIDDLKRRLSALETPQNEEVENNNTEEQLECQTQ